MTTTSNTKALKKKGPIRTEALIPVTIILALVLIYFKFFFDMNLRSAFEWVGYQVIGSEVNIDKVETSFINGSFRVSGVEITNPDKPSHNMIQIGDIRFGVLWDGLLRARIVIEEMAVEKIEIGTLRKTPGKVKPPEPVEKAKSTEPSALEKEGKKIGSQALNLTQSKYKNNVLGDVAAIMSGGSTDAQLKNIEESLPSKKQLQAFEKELQEKSKKWDEKIKSLPQAKEIESLGQRLSKVKTSNFKSPQELGESLKQIDSIVKEADAKFKTVSAVSNELNNELNSLNSQYKEIETQIKKDIKDLESRFRIPKIDAKSLTMSLLEKYMEPYLGNLNHYKSLVDKYAPPNLMKKNGKTSEPSVEIKPHPRAKGVSYEFGKPNSYPLFWIKKILVTSQAGTSKSAGNIKGLITDISSNQLLTGKPTRIEFDGTFPSLEIFGLIGKIDIDTRKTEPKISFKFDIGNYGMDGRDIISSDDAKVSFKKAQGNLKSYGEFLGLSNLSFKMENEIQKIDYDISSKNEIIDSILKEVFKGIPVVKISATAKGELPDVNLDLDSNIGSELQKGFEKQINRKIEEAKSKLNAAINEAIGKEKSKVEAELNKVKNQVDSEVKKVQDQLNKEKTKAEKQADQSKKDSEKQAQKQVEQQGQKAIDDLKKKFGL